MRAAFYERTGPADQVLQVAELPVPAPGDGEVRVRVHWSGVNPSDVKSRAGARSTALPFPRIVPHSDGMGVIDAVGEGVSRARVGERVWIWNAAWGRAFGTASEYLCLPALQAVALPEGVDDAAGACFGIPALTALQAVLTDGGVAGQRVLVAGGAGAVGHYAIQFARLLGARQVLATASTPEKQKLAREAGADVVVDYRQPQAGQLLRAASDGAGVDRVIEMDIAANAELNLAVARPGALWVVYGSGQPQFQLPFFRMIAQQLLVRFFIVYHLLPDDRERAHALLEVYLKRGALQHNVSARLPLAQIAKAHQLVESNRAGGNVVLDLRS